MTEIQLKNAVELLKGNSIESITKALKFYGSNTTAKIAKYVGCSKEELPTKLCSM